MDSYYTLKKDDPANKNIPKQQQKNLLLFNMMHNRSTKTSSSTCLLARHFS